MVRSFCLDILAEGYPAERHLIPLSEPHFLQGYKDPQYLIGEMAKVQYFGSQDAPFSWVSVR